MTRDEITAVVQTSLDDLTGAFFTTDDLNDSLQDSYDLSALVSECIETYINVNFVSNLTYYNFATSLTRYLRIIAIYNNNTNRWLEATSLLGLINIDAKWETTTGEPLYFWPVDSTYVAIYPRPASATGNMLVFYKQYANTLSGSDTPQVPDENIKVLDYLSVSDLLDQIEEFKKSLDYFKLSQETLAELAKAVDKRIQPDYVAKLR